MSEQFASLYGLTAQTIAERCRVDLATARRWKRGVSGVPYAASVLLAGDLGAFDAAWAGWKIAHGKLVSPEALEASPGDVRAIPFKEMMISSREDRIRALTEKVEALENEKGPVCDDQPLPDEWQQALPALRLVAV